jgi:hypothetical protein
MHGRAPVEGGAASGASLGAPLSIAAMPDGSMLAIFQSYPPDCRVWRIASDGTLHVAAGVGRCRFSGDGGLARRAGLRGPTSVAALPDGGFLIADADADRVRRVGPDGTIRTVRAGIHGLLSVAPTADRGVLVADASNRVQLLDAQGTMTTVAGNGKSGFSGDGGPAREASFDFYDGALDAPVSLASVAPGDFLIADVGNERVRRVTPDGVVRTVAGSGRSDDRFDEGGAAVEDGLSAPLGLLAEPDGGFLIADHGYGVVRRVDPQGRIYTVVGGASGRAIPLAGLGTAIFGGDGRAPASAVMTPVALARGLDGSLLVANWDGRRIISVSPPGAGLPAVAITATRIGRRAVHVRFVSGRPGELTASISSPRARTRRRSRIVSAGPGSLRLRRPRRSGVYRIDLTLRRQHRALARATVGVNGGRLAVRTARRAADRYADATHTARTDFSKCRRMSPSRVDCEKLGEEGCVLIHAVTVGTSGLAHFRDYLCPRHGGRVFRSHPRWSPYDYGDFPPFGPWPPFFIPHMTPAPLLRCSWDTC